MKFIINQDSKNQIYNSLIFNGKTSKNIPIEIKFSNTINLDILLSSLKKIETISKKISMIYKIDNYILSAENIKLLDELNNHLENCYDSQLYISNNEGIRLTYKEVLLANKKLDNFISSIDPTLSNYEKLVLIHQYVASYHYNEDKTSYINSSLWVSVINGDKIICSGYSSLFKACCEKMFDAKEVKAFQQKLEIYNKKTHQYIGAHSSNIIFLKDTKYNINGIYYVDSCWDSAKENSPLKNSYFCIPIKDILYHKEYDFDFYGFINVYLNQFNSNKKQNGMDTVENIFVNPFYLDEKEFAQYFTNRFNKFKSYEKVFTDEEIKFLDKFNIYYEKQNINKKKVFNYLYFLSTMNRLACQPIPYLAIENSHRLLGINKGLRGKALDIYTQNTIYKDSEKYKELFEINNCEHILAKFDINKKRS